MIIADIIEELENQKPKDLYSAILGIRKAFLVLPNKLKKEVLADFSNYEYCFSAALQKCHKTPHLSQDDWGRLSKTSIYDIYETS
jgi:hypothetical protein